MTEQKPREIAVRVLLRLEHGDFAEHLLEKALAGTRLSAVDRHFCQELVYGIVRWQATLDWLIARKTTKRPQKWPIQTLLRLGLYQIFWLDRIPPHAAVNETVELARRQGFGPQAGFINAVLRGCLREADATKSALADLRTTQPHLGYSHPEWLVAKWLKQFGSENTLKLLQWNNIRPSTFARINTIKTDAGKLLERWRMENVDYDFVRRDWMEENLVFELRSHPPLSQLASFQEGMFYVQDPSTLLAVRELAPRPGETVLDLCAAPGGKLTFIAQRMENRGRLIAHDPVPSRLELIRQNCERLGVSCVSFAPVRDAEPVEFLRALAGPLLFDRVLVDAPCSNTGVIRRRVELRWRLRPEELQRLRALQMGLLQTAFGLLKPGGTLVYSTCSLEPEENGDLLREFLQGRPGLESERTLLPFRDEVDGAYVARIRRYA